MSALGTRLARTWTHVGTRFLPFADAATPELPLGRLLRLSLFQVSVGMAVVLLIGTLNRVMIVELGVPAWLVAVMMSLPLVFAPFRALVGFRSDTHRSVLGWRRVPFHLVGHAAAVRRPGDHAVRADRAVGRHERPGLVRPDRRRRWRSCWSAPGCTRRRPSGLALATDLAPAACAAEGRGPAVHDAAAGHGRRARCSSALLLAHFSEIRLIQVVQGAALVTMVLNVVALWKQEAARSLAHRAATRRIRRFRLSVAEFTQPRQRARLCGARAGHRRFSMQDILLEPYGGQVLHLSVGDDDALTALLAAGGARRLRGRRAPAGRGRRSVSARGRRHTDRARGVQRVIFAAPLDRRCCSRRRGLIGFGAGLFAHCTLTAAMGTAALARSAWRWASGARCRHRPPVCGGGRRTDPRRRVAAGRAAARSGQALARRRYRLFRRLPHRDRPAVRDADRDRPAGAPCQVRARGTGFGLGDLPSDPLS